MKNRHADVIVIGAGSAGLAAYHALRAARIRVLLVDHGPLGTMCARVGCMPSKAMLHAAREFATARATARPDAATCESMRTRLWRDVRRMRDRLAGGTAESTRDEVGRALVMGDARFVAPDAIEVGGVRMTARAFVVATGSHPVVPETLARHGTDVAHGVLTTDTLFSLRALPASVGLIGLGNVGIEIGLALARFGVRVVAVDEKPRPAGIADPVVARRAIDTFGRELTMHLGTDGRVTRDGAGWRLAIGGQSHRVDRVLAALGRKPSLDALDLAAAGIDAADAASPPIDPHTTRLGRTAIFVAGDASPDRPLQHEAVDEGRIAAASAIALLRGVRPPRAARCTPLSIVFSDPDVAQVGLSHDDVHRDRIVVGSGGGDHNGRSKIMGDEANLVRVYADRSDGTLRGASLVSSQGEHLAHLIALAIERGLTARRMLTMPFYHPTVEEMLESALEDVVRRIDGTEGGRRARPRSRRPAPRDEP